MSTTANIIIATASAQPPWIQQFLEWSRASEPWEFWLILFGFAAQATFFARWIAQWIATERAGQSTIPLVFWWLSIAGASMLLVYYIIRHEPVGILSQCTGWLIYSRNLYLIGKTKKETRA